MPRQMYGLGSLVKSIGKGVKSAVSGVAKTVKKNPLLAAAALNFAPMAFNAKPFFGLGLTEGRFGLPAILQTGIDKLKPGPDGPTFGQFAKVFGIGALGGAALQALEASGAEEGDITDVDALRSYLRQGYQQLNPEASNDDIDAFVEQNTVEYRANGGRIGYAEGMNDPKTLPKGLSMDTTTFNPIPENALPKEIEMISKIMLGPGRSGIGEPEDGTMKGYQFFKDRYLPKKVKELSENFGYSEDDIYKMINTRVREYLGAPGKPLMAEGGRIRYAKGTEMASVDDPFYRDSEGDRDEHSFRMFNKPYKELNPEELEEFQEEMMRLMNKFSSYDYNDAMGETFEEFLRLKKIKEIPEDMEFDEYLDQLDIDIPYSKKDKGAPPIMMADLDDVRDSYSELMFGKPVKELTPEELEEFEVLFEMEYYGKKQTQDNRQMAAFGGRMKYAMGDSAEQNAMQASGIMGLPLNQNPAGITELDLRETGGFIPPVGVKEKADDIPAMLSNNEFVFTADAVRGMGGGDVEKGAQKLYDQMKMLEEGGRVA